MKRFKWTLYKTLEFLHSRRPDLEIRSSFFNQLNRLEAKLSAKGLIKYNSWDEFNEDPLIKEEELIIRNTFLNSKQKKPSLEEFIGSRKKMSLNKSSSKKPSLCWIDEVYRDRTRLVTEIKTSKSNTSFKPAKNSKKLIVKSILKGRNMIDSNSFVNNFLTQTNKPLLKTLNSFVVSENETDSGKNIVKASKSRPPTPNPDQKSNYPENEFLTNKTMNNLKEIENSKSLISQLMNRNPLLIRKKVNNFLEDNSNNNNKTYFPTSDQNIKENEEINFNMSSNQRSSSLPKKITQNSQDLNKIKKENLNRSEPKIEEEMKISKKNDTSYQRLLFENTNIIKKQVLDEIEIFILFFVRYKVNYLKIKARKKPMKIKLEWEPYQ